MPKTQFCKIAPSPERELTKWACSLFGDKSEIDVFVESTGQWETVAEVRAVSGFDAEDIAAFITKKLNKRQYLRYSKPEAEHVCTYAKGVNT